jgi:uncharacterized GH25 family protein
MFIRLSVCAIIMSVASITLSAHDFWLAAVNWTPPEGAPITITAGLGERFPTHTGFRPRPDWFDHWRVISASGDIPATMAFQHVPPVMTADVRLPSPGAYLGVMRVKPLVEEMMGAEFTEYLREEGLDRIIVAREKAGDSHKPARETYARYAKIAFRNGGGAAEHLTRAVGLMAELVPTTDPTSLRSGESLTLQLLTDGKPVQGNVVTAVSTASSVSGKTDAEGRVTLRIDTGGPWLIRTVHMVPATESQGVHWESYWVTLSFHTVDGYVPFVPFPRGSSLAINTARSSGLRPM